MADYLVWTDRASDEYEKLFEYLLNEWGDQIALKVMFEITQTIIRIKESPEHYPIFLKSKKIRRRVASPQTSIFFRIEGNTVRILSIFDNRQSPRKLKL